MLIAFYNLSQSTQQFSREGTVFIPLLQMRNLGLPEAKSSLGHTLATIASELMPLTRWIVLAEILAFIM